MNVARFALGSFVGIVLGVAACGSPATPGATSPQVAAPALPALRWVPADPMYVVAAPSLARAQAGARTAIDAIGLPIGMSADRMGEMLARELSVNMLSTEAVAAIGVDTSASVALFGDGPAPTFVVRLASPEQFAAFLDRQRERGMKTTSVQVGGTEVFTSRLGHDFDLSWAVADDWLWVRFTPSFMRADGVAWFERSRAAGASGPGAWTEGYRWAEDFAGKAAAFTGYVSAKQLLSHIAEHQREAAACLGLLSPIQRVAFSAELDGRTGKLQLAFDLGAAAPLVSRATLSVPEGFASVAQGAPISAQWNLDLTAIHTWLQPCLRAADINLDHVAATGVRSGQATVREIDIDDKTGVGVAAVTLTNKAFFARLLDDIPMRRRLESDRTFGGLQGHTLSIPFVASVDYILDDTRGFVAMGDGVLARTVGSGKTVPGPIASLDILPSALPVERWNELADAAGVSGFAVVLLQQWSELHLNAAVVDSSFVITASGTRAQR